MDDDQINAAPVRAEPTPANAPIQKIQARPKPNPRWSSHQGALARRYPNVTYFPSYEIVMANAPVSFREDDGRHVANWVVSKIVTAFKSAHFDESYAGHKSAAE
jgi:hypothetical protein